MRETSQYSSVNNYLELYGEALLELFAFDGGASRTDRVLNSLIAIEKASNEDASIQGDLPVPVPDASELLDTLVVNADLRIERGTYFESNLNYELIVAGDEPIPQAGDGGWDDHQFEPRLERLLACLHLKVGILKEEIILRSDTPDPRSMRRIPYTIVEVPSRQVGISVCNQIGQATYVFPLGTRLPATKEKLLKDGAVKVKTDRNGEWLEEICQILNWPGYMKVQGYSHATKDMKDPAYYIKENIYYDLLSFAHEAQIDSVEELSCESLKDTKATCASGLTINGMTYISRASVALGWATGKKDALKSRLKHLTALKRIAGCDLPFAERDATYYANPTWVREDLISFAICRGLPHLDDLTGQTFPQRLRKNKSVFIAFK